MARRRGGSAIRRASAARSRSRCGGWRSSASISIRCTGRRGRRADRRVLEHAARAEARRQDPRGRPVQSRRGPARRGRARRPRRLAAAALLGDSAGRSAARICRGAPVTHTVVIVYSPMQSGLLTGAFTAARAAALAGDDWRSRSEHFAGDALRRNLAARRGARPRRRASRHDRRRRRRRVDARLARASRRHRRRPAAGAGGRLARCAAARADAGRSRRDRRTPSSASAPEAARRGRARVLAAPRRLRRPPPGPRGREMYGRLYNGRMTNRPARSTRR